MSPAAPTRLERLSMQSDDSSVSAFDTAYNTRVPTRTGAAGWRFERTPDGVLTVMFIQRDTNTGGDGASPFPGAPNEGPPLQIAEPIWRQIAEDAENKVVILTGYEGAFYDNHNDQYPPGSWN